MFTDISEPLAQPEPGARAAVAGQRHVVKYPLHLAETAVAGLVLRHVRQGEMCLSLVWLQTQRAPVHARRFRKLPRASKSATQCHQRIGIIRFLRHS